MAAATKKNSKADLFDEPWSPAAGPDMRSVKRSGVDQAALSRFVAGGGLRIESLEAVAERSLWRSGRQGGVDRKKLCWRAAKER